MTTQDRHPCLSSLDAIEEREADFNEIVKLYEPNVKKLAKSPQGAGALAMLSQVYGEKLGNSEKAAKYMKMAEDADPKRVELPKWIE